MIVSIVGMSVKLFNLFVNTLRQNLPKVPRTGVQIRFSAVMDVAQPTEKDDNLVSGKVNTRYKKRFMKRQWEDEGSKEEVDRTGKKLCDSSGERIKRKKMAMLLGYCGVDYYGMQRNPGVKTIEEDLLKALLEMKYITEDDFNNQQNTQFQRSSRTDKGVSAARQVVSMKLPLEVDIEEINKRLPECIKVFGVKRVTNKFNSKVKCNARTYSYTLPTFVFEPSLETEEQRKNYRISAEKLEQVANALSFYSGTKSYHNFTEKKHYQDPSASRYMMGFTIDKVFVECEMEFAVLLVKGQSFMLHQIRKMVGLAIAVVRGHTDISMMERAFGKDKVIIPTAPGLGLVLNKVHYDRYDSKFKGSHDSLTWEAEEEAVSKFTHEFIYPNIIKGEIEGNSMLEWLNKLKIHSYDPADETADKCDENELDDDDDDVTQTENDVTNTDSISEDVTQPENDVTKTDGMSENVTQPEDDVTKTDGMSDDVTQPENDVSKTDGMSENVTQLEDDVTKTDGRSENVTQLEDDVTKTDGMSENVTQLEDDVTKNDSKSEPQKQDQNSKGKDATIISKDS